jgi:hypothetical protein
LLDKWEMNRTRKDTVWQNKLTIDPSVQHTTTKVSRRTNTQVTVLIERAKHKNIPLSLKEKTQTKTFCNVKRKISHQVQARCSCYVVLVVYQVGYGQQCTGRSYLVVKLKLCIVCYIRIFPWLKISYYIIYSTSPSQSKYTSFSIVLT